MNRFKNGDVSNPTHRQKIVDYFINSIYVFDDHIKVGYNFEDGTETILLTEMESAFSGSDMNGFAPPNQKPVFSKDTGFCLCPFFCRL